MYRRSTKTEAAIRGWRMRVDNKHTITVEITAETYKALQRMADEDDMSTADKAAELLDEITDMLAEQERIERGLAVEGETEAE